MGNASCCSAAHTVKDKELLNQTPRGSNREEEDSVEESLQPDQTSSQKQKNRRNVHAEAPESDHIKQNSSNRVGSRPGSHNEIKHQPEESNTKVIKSFGKALSLSAENNQGIMGGDPENPLKEIPEEEEEYPSPGKSQNAGEHDNDQQTEAQPGDTTPPHKHAPSGDHAKQLKATPAERLKILDEVKLEPFVFDFEELEAPNLPFLGPYLMIDSNAVYRGQFKNQYRHGKGEQFFENGSYYIGYWKNDMAHGRGRLIHKDKSYYEGGWSNDKAHGNGVHVLADGSKYEGGWYQDAKQGKGKDTWVDGTSYDGEYLNGKKHGIGIFKWADGGIYNGNFSNDDISGFGEYIWVDGKKFKGTWKNNKMHGDGEFTWPDGKRYVGKYCEDQKQGFGEFDWPDGRKYKGDWLNGKQHGVGFFTDSKGRQKKGEWEDGKHLKWL